MPPPSEPAADLRVQRLEASRRQALDTIAEHQLRFNQELAKLQDQVAHQPRSLEPLHARIAQDLIEGKPLIFAGFFGLSELHNEDPERNPCWNTYYGNARFMRRAHRDKHVRKLYAFPDWELVLEEERPADPVRTLVFHQRITPGRELRVSGVVQPFDAYLVMQAFHSREDAGLAMATSLRLSRGRTLTTRDGVTIDVGAAQVVGYAGHNFFYDWEDFYWDGFETVMGRPERPKGLFAITCRSGRVPGFMDLVGHNVYVLLFSRYFISAEGYSLLSVVDGVMQRLDGKQLVQLGDSTYQYFHTLNHPEKRIYYPFLSHSHRLFE